MQGVGATVLDRQWQWMLLLGGLQLLFSQVPSLAACWWLGTAAASLTACYSMLTLVMGCLSGEPGAQGAGGQAASAGRAPAQLLLAPLSGSAPA